MALSCVPLRESGGRVEPASASGRWARSHGTWGAHGGLAPCWDHVQGADTHGTPVCAGACRVEAPCPCKSLHTSRRSVPGAAVLDVLHECHRAGSWPPGSLTEVTVHVAWEGAFSYLLHHHGRAPVTTLLFPGRVEVGLCFPPGALCELRKPQSPHCHLFMPHLTFSSSPRPCHVISLEVLAA